METSTLELENNVTNLKTCVHFFLLQSAKEYILKNVGNLRVLSSIDFHRRKSGIQVWNDMKVSKR